MNPSSALATVLVDELIRGGVRDVVLCPGSRSAPLAYAVQAAEAAGRLRLHVRVDERSAGFLGLGLSKGSGGVPVAVMTTSGTAVANLHPAVLEAHHSGVPLVVVSADRPGELQGTGANQTTTQPGMFAGALRWSTDLPAAEVVPDQNAWWRGSVCRALAAAQGVLGGDPGPVHLNAGFRLPLVPGAPGSRDFVENWPEPLDGRPDGSPWTRVGRAGAVGWGSAGGRGGAGDRADAAFEDKSGIAHVERTLVVIGDLGGGDRALRALAWALNRGYPVLAEPFGSLQVRREALPHGPLLLTAADWLAEHLPDRAVVIGRVTLARPVARLLRRSSVALEVVTTTTAWPDPAQRAQRVHSFDVIDADLARASSRARLPDRALRGDWARTWDDAAAVLAARVCVRDLGWPSGLGVADAVASALPEGAVLVVGSSNPVRDLDLALTGRRDASDAVSPVDAIGTVDVVANRGLAGIDGVVSTAVGVALTSARPSYALVGDLTFLHDSGGLIIGPDEPRPDLTIVVVNDDGGGIFTTLEHGHPSREQTFERLFGTPTGTDLAALCAAHGIRHERVEDRAALVAGVAARPRGITVLEVPVDRNTHRQAHADLRAAAAQALHH